MKYTDKKKKKKEKQQSKRRDKSGETSKTIQDNLFIPRTH